ncbi:MAG: tetratricopeptide repeat protein, partial [Cyclobacteriaceae bacterium]
LYHSDDDKQTRDTNYASFMGKLKEKYPQNHEVATFYSLALLAAVPEGRDDKIYAKAAQIAQSVLDQNQQHPGALHYLIHSYDDPQHATLALQAAKGYARVAPDAAHALHMPSHIYVALGMWDEVVSSNERSYQASLDRRERKQLDNDARGYHSFYWLMYGYLQQGRFREAEKIVKDMITYTNELPSTRARVYLEMMKGTYGIETGNWGIEWPGEDQKTKDLNIIFQTIPLFMKGLAAYEANDSLQLQNLLEKMTTALEYASTQLIEKDLTVCGNLPVTKPDQIDVDQSTVLEWELNALQAWLAEDTTKTREWFRKAVELESKISYSFGPPIIVKPSNELYGEWLLEINQPEEASNQFELALEKAPKRVLSLKGKAEAARRLGDQAVASEIEGELLSIGKGSDQKASI